MSAEHDSACEPLSLRKSRARSSFFQILSGCKPAEILPRQPVAAAPLRVLPRGGLHKKDRYLKNHLTSSHIMSHGEAQSMRHTFSRTVRLHDQPSMHGSSRTIDRSMLPQPFQRTSKNTELSFFVQELFSAEHGPRAFGLRCALSCFAEVHALQLARKISSELASRVPTVFTSLHIHMIHQLGWKQGFCPLMIYRSACC